MAAIHSACQTESLQKLSAVPLRIMTRLSEHPSDNIQFFIIDFKNIAPVQRITYRLLSVEILTQVYIENPVNIITVRHCLKK